ncbi:MAG: L-histidine N(alpha)-methyltransferase [Chloroflexi bacterium]|nr:L-histidine N(alpha)-methyltransferase [Chloroflexota bacterium]
MAFAPQGQQATRGPLEEVLDGLRSPQKTLPCKLFYDERGSQLFDEICELDEYYVTRTELSIMEKHSNEMAAALGPETLLVEYGSGASTKTRLLLEQLENPAGYVPIDISGDYLLETSEQLSRDYPAVPVYPLAADFTAQFDLPVAAQRRGNRAVYFPGSTIGNFEVSEAAQLLKNVAKLVGSSGKLLIGVDLEKKPEILRNAYSDSKGITAEFNRNILSHINVAYRGTFDVNSFDHQAVYNADKARIEMRLLSSRDQTVRVCEEIFTFAAGESILTEYSHKYTVERFGAIARDAGLSLREVWTDPENLFSVQLYEVA